MRLSCWWKQLALWPVHDVTLPRQVAHSPCRGWRLLGLVTVGLARPWQAPKGVLKPSSWCWPSRMGPCLLFLLECPAAREMSQFRHHHYPPPATACLPAECPLLIVLGVGWLLIEVSLGYRQDRRPTTRTWGPGSRDPWWPPNPGVPPSCQARPGAYDGLAAPKGR